MNLDESQRAAQEQFDRQSERYGRSHLLADTSDIDATVRRLDLPARGRALDIATGGGHCGLWLARKGFLVTLADVSQRMLENASRLLDEEGYLCETRQHPAEELPYTGRSFEVVACRVAAHHFSDPPAFVFEVARVLAPGGLFILIDGTAPEDNPQAEAWLHDVEKLRDPSHGRLLRPDQWKRLCLGAGMEVLECFVSRLKQPDLEWYFETANTPPANREKVRDLVSHAPKGARRAFSIAEVHGKTVWQWPRLHLAARKS